MTTRNLIDNLKRDFLLTDKQAEEEVKNMIVDSVNKGIVPIKERRGNKTILNI
jgi:hypothetical protein